MEIRNNENPKYTPFYAMSQMPRTEMMNENDEIWKQEEKKHDQNLYKCPRKPFWRKKKKKEKKRFCPVLMPKETQGEKREIVQAFTLAKVGSEKVEGIELS